MGRLPAALTPERSSARLHRGPSALLAKQWKTRLRQPREKPQRQLKYLSQKIRLPASAAAAGNNAALVT
jgi:hypothetical protein